MNGRPRVAYFSFWAAARQPAPAWLRVCTALAISFLLHTALVLLPDPGVGSPFFPPARGSLDVRLPPSEAAPPVAAQEAVKAVAESRRAGRASRKESAAAQHVLPIPAHHFYTADQLTSRARPVNRPMLEAPELAQIPTSGAVILRIWIDALGNVLAVEIEKSDVPQALAATAAAAFRDLRFIPGQIGSRRVASLMRVEVTYLDGKQAINVLGAPR
jgi:TonB family protein